jgi:hypothetical protein
MHFVSYHCGLKWTEVDRSGLKWTEVAQSYIMVIPVSKGVSKSQDYP